MTDIAQSPEGKELQAKIELGLQVEAWVNEEIPQYLFDRANEVIDDVAHQLLDVNPTDHATIAALQVQGKAATYFKVWLEEAVSDGIQAADEIDAAPE